MKAFQFLLIKIMILLLFSTTAVAKCLFPDWESVNPMSLVVHYNQGKPHADTDWVGDAWVEDGFFASGSLYMEYDYFLANVEKGLEFDAKKGSVHFLPNSESFSVPSFEQYDDELGVAYNFDGPKIDYWITADSSIDASYFFAKKNIYIIDSSLPSEVPLPAAAWLFGSALLGMIGWKRRGLA